jgi:hypothetical protein
MDRVQNNPKSSVQHKPSSESFQVYQTNYSQTQEKENTLIQKKWKNRNKDEEKYTKNAVTGNYITENIRIMNK